MTDQAEKLRLLVQEKEEQAGGVRPQRIITVTSGKGGVGKTSLSVNLAVELSRRGKRVLVLDADLGLANVNIVAGVAPRHNLYHVFKHGKELHEILEEGPGGIKIISGATGFAEVADLSNEQRDRFIRSLEHFKEAFDYLVIDTAAGLSVNVLNFALLADEVIVVATPELTSISDAYGLIKAVAAKEDHPPLRLVINRAESISEAKRVADKMTGMATQFLGSSLRVGGYLLTDSLVAKAVQRQKPFVASHPNSKPARFVADVATRLLAAESESEALSEAGSKDEKNGSWWRRVMKRFC